MRNFLVLALFCLATAVLVGCGDSPAPVAPAAPPVAAPAPEVKPEAAAKTEPVDDSDNPWADAKVSTHGAIGNALKSAIPGMSSIPGAVTPPAPPIAVPPKQ